MCFLQTKKTALHYAAEYYSAKIVKISIDAGADVKTFNEVSKIIILSHWSHTSKGFAGVYISYIRVDN